MDQEEQRAHELKELSAQVARVKKKTAQVKEKTRPWKETIALIFAIAAAEVSLNSTTIFAMLSIMPRAAHRHRVRAGHRLLRAGNRRGVRHLGQDAGLL